MTLYGLSDYQIDDPNEVFTTLKDAEDALASSNGGGVVLQYNVKEEGLMILSRNSSWQGPHQPVKYWCKCGPNDSRGECPKCEETRGGESK